MLVNCQDLEFRGAEKKEQAERLGGKGIGKDQGEYILDPYA